MRKIWYLFLIGAIALIFGACAGMNQHQQAAAKPEAEANGPYTADNYQQEIAAKMNTEAPTPATIENFSKTPGKSLKVSFVRREDNYLVWQLNGIRLVPMNQPKVDSVAAKNLKLSSDLHEYYYGASKTYVYSFEVPDSGEIEFRPFNYAIATGQPTVEKHHGIGQDHQGENKFLMLDPNDKWVIYVEASEDSSRAYWVDADQVYCDLNTLSIAYVMYPDADPRPLKEVLKEKGEKYTLDYGAKEHPELGSQKVSQATQP